MADPALRCRICGRQDLSLVLSLGRMALANALLPPDADLDAEPTYPLELYRCPSCSLVQIGETVDPELLFGEYAYFSSYSDTMLRHARELAHRLVRERELGPGSLVVELASNDGYLLRSYQRRGVPVLGVEPARNVARVAAQRGVPTHVAFFDAAVARELVDQGRRADVIHANNVLAHVADLHGFVEGAALLLKDDGLLVVEVPHVRELCERRAFDTIYHEHLCYFSVTALEHLFEMHGLQLVEVERLGIHGGSLRLHAQRAGEGRAVRATVRELLSEEEAWGVRTEAPYVAFADSVRDLRGSLRELVAELRGRGDRVAAYGAAAKGTVLLNYLGLLPGTVDFVVDRSPHKQGRLLPGVHVAIVEPGRLLAEQPDYTLLLPWNLADEIIAQQVEYLRRGGRFIVPVPEPRIVGVEALSSLPRGVLEGG